MLETFRQAAATEVHLSILNSSMQSADAAGKGSLTPPVLLDKQPDFMSSRETSCPGQAYLEFIVVT